jgi:type II secretory pathway component PulF
VRKVFKFSAEMVDGTIVNDYIKTDSVMTAKRLISELGYKIRYIEIDHLRTLTNIYEKKIPLRNLKEIVAIFYNTIKQGINPEIIVETIPEMFTGYTKQQTLRIKKLITTQGLSLSKVFELIGMNTFIVKAIESAEKESGNLEEVLGKVVFLLDVLAKGESELAKALINPKIILTIITLIIYIVYGFAMKKALGFFENHLTYGITTKIVIAITNLININVYVSGFVVALIILGIWKLFTVKTIFAVASFPNYLKYKFPRWKDYGISRALINGLSFILKPFMALQENYEIMKICYFIDLLYSAGVKPDVIIQYLTEIVDSKYMKQMLLSTLPYIRMGQPFYEAFKFVGFKPDFIGFLKAGAETTQLEYYMVSFAENKKMLFERSIFALSTVLPLIMLVFASGFIIFTFAGIYLPMFNLK